MYSPGNFKTVYTPVTPTGYTRAGGSSLSKTANGHFYYILANRQEQYKELWTIQIAHSTDGQNWTESWYHDCFIPQGNAGTGPRPDPPPYYYGAETISRVVYANGIYAFAVNWRGYESITSAGHPANNRSLYETQDSHTGRIFYSSNPEGPWSVTVLDDSLIYGNWEGGLPQIYGITGLFYENNKWVASGSWRNPGWHDYFHFVSPTMVATADSITGPWDVKLHPVGNPKGAPLFNEWGSPAWIFCPSYSLYLNGCDDTNWVGWQDQVVNYGFKGTPITGQKFVYSLTSDPKGDWSVPWDDSGGGGLGGFNPGSEQYNHKSSYFDRDTGWWSLAVNQVPIMVRQGEIAPVNNWVQESSWSSGTLVSHFQGPIATDGEYWVTTMEYFSSNAYRRYGQYFYNPDGVHSVVGSFVRDAGTGDPVWDVLWLGGDTHLGHSHFLFEGGWWSGATSTMSLKLNWHPTHYASAIRTTLRPISQSEARKRIGNVALRLGSRDDGKGVTERHGRINTVREEWSSDRSNRLQYGQDGTYQ